MNELKSLNDAYQILATLFSQAWAEPGHVPTQIALLLLHAREHVGMQIEQYLTCQPAIWPVKANVCSGDAVPAAA